MFILIIFIILGFYLFLDKYGDKNFLLTEYFELYDKQKNNVNDYDYFEENKIEVNEKKNRLPITKNNFSIVSKCFSRNQLASFDEYEKFSEKFYFKNKNKIKGEVWITPTNKIEDLPQITLNGFYINNLCVLEKYRKQGIARKLMNYIIEKCRNNDGLHLMLHVDLNNSLTKSLEEHYLVKFYKSLGFSIYEQDSNSVLMFMSL